MRDDERTAEAEPTSFNDDPRPLEHPEVHAKFMQERQNETPVEY